MKYKVDKGTETYAQFAELMQRLDAIKSQSDALCVEVGAKAVYVDTSYLSGSISGFVFNTKPENWRCVDSTISLYYPKSVKATEGIRGKISAIPRIGLKELNAIVGFSPFSYADGSGIRIIKHIGYAMKTEYCLVDVHSETPNYTPNADMVEILESEFFRLKMEGDGRL